MHCCSLGSCAAKLKLWGTSIMQITNSHPPREKYRRSSPGFETKERHQVEEKHMDSCKLCADLEDLVSTRGLLQLCEH